MTESTLRLLAAAAHLCWCERLAEEGWKHAQEYSATARTHDALVPFEGLSIADQRRTLRVLRCEDVATMLAELLAYPRGEPGLPEIQPEDMLVGRVVELLPELRTQDIAGWAKRGRIISWVINQDSGDLDLVRVRWDDGRESEHTPPEREIMLVDASDSAA